MRITVSGNTVGLNYKVKYKVLSGSPAYPVADFEIEAGKSMTIDWTDALSLLPYSVNEVEIECEASGNKCSRTIDFGSVFQETIEFNMTEGEEGNI